MTALLFGLFYVGLFALALASVAAAAFGGIAALATRDVAGGRRQFIRNAVLLPFLSVAWFAAIFLLYLGATIGGDEKEPFRMQLPNRYEFFMPAGAERGDVTGQDGRHVITGLSRLQVAGERVYGTRFAEDEMARMREWYTKGLAGTHMILETGTGRETWLEERAFAAEATRLGAPPALVPVTQMREAAWPEMSSWVALVLALGAPVAGLFLLVRQGIRLRRTAPAA